jgi:hypothetical protein
MAMSTRRNLIKVAATGGMSAALGLTIKPGSEARAVASPQHDHGQADIWPSGSGNCQLWAVVNKPGAR